MLQKIIGSLPQAINTFDGVSTKSFPLRNKIIAISLIVFIGLASYFAYRNRKISITKPKAEKPPHPSTTQTKTTLFNSKTITQEEAQVIFDEGEDYLETDENRVRYLSHIKIAKHTLRIMLRAGEKPIEFKGAKTVLFPDQNLGISAPGKNIEKKETSGVSRQFEYEGKIYFVHEAKNVFKALAV